MMLDATQRYNKPLTKDRLFDWHAALFPTGRSGITRIRVGAWRDGSTGPMQVVSGPIGRERVHFEAPAADKLDAEMARFLAWFEEPTDIDPVIKAALAHLWFVTIHPFDDGNGRIARAIADMALARSEGSPQRFYSMSAQIRTERKTTTTCWKPRRRVTWTSRLGSHGSSPALVAPSKGLRQRSHRSWQGAVLGQAPRCAIQ